MSAVRPTLDLLDPEWYRSNPHDDYAWMRANEPVYRDERNGLWAITRHADVLDVERRSNVFSSQGTYRAVPEAMEIDMIAHSCGCRHARELRREHVRIVQSAGRSVALNVLYPYPETNAKLKAA